MRRFCWCGEQLCIGRAGFEGTVDMAVWKTLAPLSLLGCEVLSDSFATSWTVGPQAALSTGFPGKDTGSELPFPTPGDLLNPGIEAVSLGSSALAGGFFIASTS